MKVNNLYKRLLLIVFICSYFLLDIKAQKDTVKIQFKWYHQFQFAGYYAAKNQGYYEEQGLYVDLLEGFPGVDISNEVITGKADLGIQSSIIILERSKGNPVVVLGAIFQHSPLVLIAKGEDLYASPQGLSKKRIMWRERSDAEIPAMLINESVYDYTHVDHSWELEVFINDEVDAFTAYITDQPYQLIQQGVSFNLIRPINYGVDFYGDIIFTSEKYLKKNEKVIQRFLEATYRGWEFAMQNPDYMINYIIETYPNTLNSDALRYEYEAMKDLILPEFIPIGFMNSGRWKHIYDVYEKQGLTSGQVDFDDFIYNPELQKKKRQKTFLYVALSSILSLLIISIILFLVKQRLESLVNLKTQELSISNDELEIKLKEIEQLNVKLENALQKAQESEQFKMAFIQNISHEIRTPLNAIIGFSNILGESKKDELDKEKIAEIIETNGEILTSAIDNLLQVSDLQSTTKDLSVDKILLSELCQELIEYRYKQTKNSTLELLFDDSSRPKIIYSNKLTLIQIINNLMSNAFKHTKQGNIKLGYKPFVENKILFYVSDTGIGIEEKDYKVIFERFTKLNKFNLGTGLGLYICKSLVEKLGGEIWVESEKNKGSVFYFTFKQIKNQRT